MHECDKNIQTQYILDYAFIYMYIYTYYKQGISFSVKRISSIYMYIGIHVLRILKYDRQALAMRRLQCENVDADPIVWTNQRFIRWARSIDLGEYADNLKGTQNSTKLFA